MSEVSLIDGHIDEVKQTNYDRVRNMSVKELADLLVRRKFSCMPFCKNCEICTQKTFCYPLCIDGVKKWLESEVDSE